MFRRVVVRKCERMDVDVMASDGGAHVCTQGYRSQPDTAFEGVLPGGRLWWVPPINLTSVLGQITCARPDGWHGASFCLALNAVGRRSRTYRFLGKVLSTLKGERFFANVAYGHRTITPSYRSDDCAVSVLKNAFGAFARA